MFISSCKPYASAMLTAKQEAFCLAYIETGNASEAYRQAYNADAMKPATVHRNAKFLLDDNKIATRIASLREPMRAKVEYSYECAMREAQEALELAARLENPSAMVAAATLRAKLSGLMVEDRKNARQPLESLPTDVLLRLEAELASRCATH